MAGRKGALVDALIDRHVYFRYLVRSVEVVDVDLTRGVEADELGRGVLYEAEGAFDSDVRLRGRGGTIVVFRQNVGVLGEVQLSVGALARLELVLDCFFILAASQIDAVHSERAGGWSVCGSLTTVFGAAYWLPHGRGILDRRTVSKLLFYNRPMISPQLLLIYEHSSLNFSLSFDRIAYDELHIQDAFECEDQRCRAQYIAWLSLQG